MVEECLLYLKINNNVSLSYCIIQKAFLGSGLSVSMYRWTKDKNTVISVTIENSVFDSNGCTNKGSPSEF